VLDRLGASKHEFTVDKMKYHGHASQTLPDDKAGAETPKTGSGARTDWDPTDHSPFADGVAEDPCATLYHELNHAAAMDTGDRGDFTCQFKDGTSPGLTRGELQAFQAENVYRAAAKLPPRTMDGRTFVPSTTQDSSNCKQPPPPAPRSGGGCNGGCSVSPCGVGCGGSNGDPHLLTFDQYRYDFQAVGEFVLARGLAPGLQVQARQTPLPGSRSASVDTAFAADVAGDRVGVYLGQQGMELHVAGARADLTQPVKLAHGGTATQLVNLDIDVVWPDGSDMLVHQVGYWGMRATITLAASWRGRVEGLLGNFDGDQSNDLRISGGEGLAEPPTFGSLYPKFADSWRITQAGSLFDYGSGQSTATFTDRSFPDREVTASSVPGRDAAEAVCRRAGVVDPKILDACIVDVGVSGQAIFASDEAQVQATGGSSALLVVNRPGAIARWTFPATAGEKVFVDVTSSNLPDDCGGLRLRDPSGSVMNSGCIINGAGFIDGTALPTAGQYTVELAPEAPHTGQAQLLLVTDDDQQVPIQIDGPAVAATVGQPGAVARLTFSAAAGQKVFVDVPTSGLPDDCGAVKLRGPDGAVLNSGCLIQGSGFVDASVLPTSGQYTILIDPYGRNTGDSQVRLIEDHDQQQAITPGGSAVSVDIGQPGAVARLTFQGTAGQKVFVDVPWSSLPSDCGVLSLRGPDGSSLNSGCIINGKGSIDGTTLPASGTYTILVDPEGRNTGQAQIQVHT
jgi:hypothetical protein